VTTIKRLATAMAAIIKSRSPMGWPFGCQVGAGMGVTIGSGGVEIENTEGSQEGVLIGAAAAGMLALGSAKPHFGQGDRADGDGRWACVAGATGKRFTQLHQVDAGVGVEKVAHGESTSTVL